LKGAKMTLKRIFTLFAFMFIALMIVGCAVPFQGGMGKNLQVITYQDFLEAEKEDRYFRGRWSYFSVVVDLVQKIKPKSVLELGPYKLPLVKGADTMDIRKHIENLTYLHDANKIPWPIADNKYDLFIACQVWEHLDNKQKEAFKEVMRISRRAILSFPYKWRYKNGPKTASQKRHANIDDAKIAEWTLHKKPKKIIFNHNKKYAVYYFEFNK